MGTAAQDISAMARNTFSQLSTIQLQLDTVPLQLGETLVLIGKVLLPILGSCALAAMLSGGLQSGFNLTPDVIGFKPERLNPLPGFQRIFSKGALVHAGIDLLKLVAIGLVLWVAAKGFFEDPLFSRSPSNLSTSAIS
ncbi:MAG: EscU/YscU/HrcU family type III secretion system export apparatus switch protein [Nibricoccus sp.]